MTTTTVIRGTGSVIPDLLVPNSSFLANEFYDKEGNRLDRSSEEIIAKLEEITGIRERRYVPFDQDSIGLMTEASRLAVEDAGISVDDLSGIIVAHNAGNMVPGTGAFHTVPNLAAALKHELHDTNHNCFAYDLLFGCPGWLQGIIQAHQAMAAGDAEHVLVVGLEIASRMLDPHDVDSMILADGCGACVVSRSEINDGGLISHATYSHGQDDNRIIYLGPSNKRGVEGDCYFHMNGREVYKYATRWVPLVIKDALDKARTSITDVGIFLFHQANAKMLCSITKNLAELCGVAQEQFDGKVPTTIEFLGNTSVATIPTMLDLIRKGRLGAYRIERGMKAVMASVGAGMHCNAIVYEF
ncbi:MAG: ketoacyl-ACP synthase III [Chloracidobacterium sp.]|nr:ketoacyl-ACP synthase III [Chloracidobacterium sp.]